ncbi:molybdenum cofactor biosynthesis protein A [Gloeomargarita lithophora Alchichica-D10]|uniref:GTP 3',8-cyclase n=1 Tax=Gloeomargarita lithophora Alchichica-D10 TaxID=1188229 RepID=A0A1J0ADU6_9CYAN|nr:GTP 3',8-cyclase MoaA [Gloeomargarita lithophora]APB34083.1 molybdenum cofactor biosynthesis protein A [Gloeomargarita lithophora Alchichica-D10]
MELVDPWHRRIRKLRVSLTDRCNLRCRYCMPLHPDFMNKSYYLKTHEYAEIIQELLTYGIEEIRITGGEPLVRPEFPEIMLELHKLKIPCLSLTTNGALLQDHWEILKACNIKKINISLDSLEAETFTAITHWKYLSTILDNISQAVTQGFEIKINMVIMRGINDHELFDFVEYARKSSIAVRFLELMRIGYANELYQNHFISAEECIIKLKTRYRMNKINVESDSTAFYFMIDDEIKVGFIASESQPFCNHCSRWRLSADGRLFACLFAETGIPIRNVSSEQRNHVYQQLLGMKPIQRFDQVKHPMYQIGG